MTNFQHRHRTPGYQTEKDRLQGVPDRVFIVSDERAMKWDDRTDDELVLRGIFHDLNAMKYRLAQHSRLKWLLAVYCSLCLVFTSSGIFSHVTTAPDVSFPQPQFGKRTAALLSLVGFIIPK